MTNKLAPVFIVVDDESINNLICRKMIELTIKGAVVNTFTDPELAIKWMFLNYGGDTIVENANLLLDINMPILSGWAVLERIQKEGRTAQHLNIYILSSSVDNSDIYYAENHPLVTSFIIKPLSKDKIKTLFPQYLT